jgi:hypothetical protein
VALKPTVEWNSDTNVPSTFDEWGQPQRAAHVPERGQPVAPQWAVSESERRRKRAWVTKQRSMALQQFMAGKRSRQWLNDMLRKFPLSDQSRKRPPGRRLPPSLRKTASALPPAPPPTTVAEKPQHVQLPPAMAASIRTGVQALGSTAAPTAGRWDAVGSARWGGHQPVPMQWGAPTGASRLLSTTVSIASRHHVAVEPPLYQLHTTHISQQGTDPAPDNATDMPVHPTAVVVEAISHSLPPAAAAAPVAPLPPVPDHHQALPQRHTLPDHHTLLSMIDMVHDIETSEMLSQQALQRLPSSATPTVRAATVGVPEPPSPEALELARFQSQYPPEEPLLSDERLDVLARHASQRRERLSWAVQPSGGQQFSTNAAAIAIADVLLRELTDDTIRMTLDTAVENVAQAVVGAA